MTALFELFERLMLSLLVLSVFATLLIILIVVADVTGRFLFNAPFHCGVVCRELLMVALVFFGLAAAQQQRQNFSIELLVRHFPRRVQCAFELFGYVTCLLIVVILAWPSSKQALVSFERGEAGFGIVSFPLWPARTLLAIGLWLLALQFLCDIYRFVANKPRATRTESSEKVYE